MKKINISLLLLCLCSCVSEVNLDINANNCKRLSVEGQITNIPGRQYVKLSAFSDNFSNCEFQAVNGAEVFVSDGKTRVPFSESGNFGLYFPPEGWAAEPGTTYTLAVSTDEDGIAGKYIASSRMPAQGLRLDKFECTCDDAGNRFKLKVWMQDFTGDEEKHYILDSGINGQTFCTAALTGGELFQGIYLVGVTLGEVSFPTMYVPYDGKKLPERANPGDEISLCLYNVEKTFFDYIIGFSNESSPRLPLLMPQPGNLPSNVSGGAVGFFAACYASAASYKIR